MNMRFLALGGVYFESPCIDACCRKSISVHGGQSTVRRYAQGGVWRTRRWEGRSRRQKYVFLSLV